MIEILIAYLNWYYWFLEKKKRKNMRQNLCALIQGIPWQKIDFCNRFRSLNSWTESDLKLFMLLKGNSLQICTAATTLLHEIIFHISVSISSFCFNSFLEEKPLISFLLYSLKSGWTLYFLFFPLLMSWKRFYIFFIWSWW